MTKEELIKLSRENLRKSKQGSLCECYDEAFIKGYELSKKRIAELEAQIEKMKQELDTAREDANRQEQWELYSVLNGIYNDNFEVTTSVSN